MACFEINLSLNEKQIFSPSILPLLITAKVRLSTLATFLTHVAETNLILNYFYIMGEKCSKIYFLCETRLVKQFNMLIK